MPASELHEKQYEVNIDVINHLKGRDSPPYDWIVTVYFYAALHLIEKKLAAYDVHSPDHFERNKKVRILFQKISVYYESLYLLSQSARYDCVEINQGKVKLAKSHLDEIVKFVQK